MHISCVNSSFYAIIVSIASEQQYWQLPGWVARLLGSNVRLGRRQRLQRALERYLRFGGLPAAVAEAASGRTEPSAEVQAILWDSIVKEVQRRGASVPAAQALLNVEEVWRGAGHSEAEAVGRLLGALRVAPLGRAEGEVAGLWRSRFAASGETLSQADCLIAAAALGVGTRLATGNPRDFPTAELEVEHWPVCNFR